MKRLIQNKHFSRVCCAVLCAAMLASIVLPAAARASAQPEAPELPAQSEITLLGGGEAAAEYESGQSTSDARADAGTAGGTTGTQGGDRPDPENHDTQSATSSDEERDNNIEKSEQDGKQEPQSDGTKPSEADFAEAEIGTTTGPEEPDNTTDSDDSGSDGEDDSRLELAAVLTWYKYGNEENTVVCAPEESVGKRILTSQLEKGRFSYKIELAGPEAGAAEINAVTLMQGGRVQSASASGSLDMQTAGDGSAQRYVFYIEASVARTDENGVRELVDTDFTFVVSCEDGLDLSLAMNWPQSSGTASLSVAADASASRDVRSSELESGELRYAFTLTGLSAGDAEIVEASYISAHAQSGELDKTAGTLTLTLPEDADSEQYTLTLRAEVNEGGTVRTVTFTVYLRYLRDDDLSLELTWYRGGLTAEKITCGKDASAAAKIKQNQLINGTFQYYLALTGESASKARLTSMKLTGPGVSETMGESGSAAFRIPTGESAAVYTVQVTAKLNSGKTATFQITITYSSDVSAEMRYTVNIDGTSGEQTVRCENGRTATPELIFSDQLEDGVLPFSFSISGEDAGAVRLEKLTLYQSGSGRERTLASEIGTADYSGSAVLLDNNGRAGKNQFVLTAVDEDGGSYTFTFLLRYQTRGDKEVKIEVSLDDGQEIINESDITLRVTAYSVEADGTVVSYIRATGAETELHVELDGERLDYTGASGNTQEYTVYAKNPEEGDTNTHTLHIFARDEYGNEGERTLTLKGRRMEDGKETGATVSISVDLSVLGMGVYGPISYNVRVGEPVSYVIAKTLWGEDIDETFGGATEATLGFDKAYCSYGGSLKTGFYLKSLGGSILGTPQYYTKQGAVNSAETLADINAQFGEETALAALWRCIVRNNIPITAAGGMSIGEHNFTDGSGWMYAIDGGYYPNRGMSEYKLSDLTGNSHTLTLRYTLAYGWDVGSGSTGYGNSVGYCVQLVNGRFEVNHQWEEKKTEEGAKKFVCKCCGLEQDCPHEHIEYRDNDDGTCGEYCLDCETYPYGTKAHTWDYSFEPDSEQHKKTCTVCKLEEMEDHDWDETEDEGTCKDGGKPAVLHRKCKLCKMEKDTELEVPAHKFEKIKSNERGHWKVCSVCGMPEAGTTEAPEVEAHSYIYDGKNWICSVCNGRHAWLCKGKLTEKERDCEHLVCVCSGCGAEFREDFKTPEHKFDKQEANEYGHYMVCSVCGMPEAGTLESPVVTPHDYSFDGADGICSGCGKRHSEVCSGTMALTEHNCRQRVYVCSVCHAGYTENGEFDDHNYQDGRCLTCGGEDPDYTAPTDPDGPTGPTEPTDPTDPTEPSGPTEPTEPEEPETPSGGE